MRMRCWLAFWLHHLAFLLDPPIEPVVFMTRGEKTPDLDSIAEGEKFPCL